MDQTLLPAHRTPRVASRRRASVWPLPSNRFDTMAKAGFLVNREGLRCGADIPQGGSFAQGPESVPLEVGCRRRHGGINAQDLIDVGQL
jgi:hypothetical protein